ncbi:MAG: hypothetical protein ACP5RF_01020 [Candidatus Micrarchaeia archaeon]
MPDFKVSITSTPETMKSFRRNELELMLSVTSEENQPPFNYWVEAIVTVPHLTSLAPDRPLENGKLLLGIISNGSAKEKRFKLFANNNIYPDTYKIMLTILFYDSEGAVAERQDVTKEIVCSD